MIRIIGTMIHVLGEILAMVFATVVFPVAIVLIAIVMGLPLGGMN